MHRIAIFSTLFLVSCSSVQYQEVYVNAISTQEEELPCVILVEDEIQLGDDNAAILTPVKIRLPFYLKNDGSGFEGTKLGVKAVKVEDGKIIHGLNRGEESEYNTDWRSVHLGDATKQLFILYRKRVGA